MELTARSPARRHLRGQIYEDHLRCTHDDCGTTGARAVTKPGRPWGYDALCPEHDDGSENI